MSYAVKEIYLTLQGEGAQAGRVAVFCRFAGCNLWSGREEDRSRAVCRFCDTDFVGIDGPGGGRFGHAEDLADAIAACWSPGMVDGDRAKPLVVLTGGEPLLQLDAALIEAVHARGFEIAVESNGTIAAPAGIDWLTISPKADAPLLHKCGQELKLVWPQEGIDPAEFAQLDFAHYFLQPMDGPDLKANIRSAAHYCLAHPQWRLSIQMHKVIGLP